MSNAATNNTTRVQTEILNDTLKLVELWFPTLDTEEKKKSKEIISKVLEHIKEKSVAVNSELKSKVETFVAEEPQPVALTEEPKNETLEVEQVEEVVDDEEEAKNEEAKNEEAKNEPVAEAVAEAEAEPEAEKPLEAEGAIVLEEETPANANTNTLGNNPLNQIQSNLLSNTVVEEATEKSTANTTVNTKNTNNTKNTKNTNTNKENQARTAEPVPRSTNPFNTNQNNVQAPSLNPFDEEKKGGKRHTSRRRRNKASASAKKRKTVSRKK